MVSLLLRLIALSLVVVALLLPILSLVLLILLPTSLLLGLVNPLLATLLRLPVRRLDIVESFSDLVFVLADLISDVVPGFAFGF